MTMINFWIIKLLLVLAHETGLLSCYDLHNITGAVFGQSPKDSSFIPAAFGDFNSDKLTDLIVFDSDMKNVEVLLASEQSVVSVESNPIFRGNPKTLKCACPDDCTFVSGAPADFDGDGSMDVMMVTEKDGSKGMIIMWGDTRNLDCSHPLTVSKDLSKEPLVLDFNGDSISDLLTVEKEDNIFKRIVYVFGKDRTFTKKQLSSDKTDDLKAEHGNSIVDVTEDGRADLVLTTQSGLEIHQGVKDGFEYLCTVSWPEDIKGSVDQCVGQPVFLDFSLSGSLDMILPVCSDPKCEKSLLYLVPVSKLSSCPTKDTTWSSSWRPLTIDLGENMLFYPRKESMKPNLQLMTPRVGDVDLDGFPDILMTFYNSSEGYNQLGQVHLLLNVPCTAMTDSCNPVWRKFQLQPGYTQGVGPAVTGAFFDLYEDGKLDLIVVGQDDDKRLRVSAFTNTTQDSDAYFMKVIVLSGACYHNCEHHDTSYVPYGTNAGGQLVSYRSQRPGQETFDSYQSVAVQMPQTSHYALAMPYTIFGLGMAPNFVDYLSVNISSLSRDWPQIIPNSQLYVIPYPHDKPESWDLKLIITTSKNIVITGLALVGTCALCTVIIVLLHIRQKRQDKQAKLQEASRFHFDAM